MFALKCAPKRTLLPSTGHPALIRPSFGGLAIVQNRLTSSGTETKEGSGLPFHDAKVAFSTKTTFELLRTYLIFKVCGIGPIVRHCDKLYNMSARILGTTLTHGCLRYSFFNHFCAGETVTDIKPRLMFLRSQGVGGILDYAAEAKEDDGPKAEPVEVEAGSVGAPLSSRKYTYEGEATCDANTEIFLDAIRNVREATPEGFAAIKLSGLGNPVLLERLSDLKVELAILFKNLSGDNLEDVVRGTPYNAIDLKFSLNLEQFTNGWKRHFVEQSDDVIKQKFEAMDLDQDGLVDYVEFSNTMKLSQINGLVATCSEEGPLSRASLDEEEVKLYKTMIRRVQKILDLAQELKVRVMVDAEWMDIQPAIDHIVLHLQRSYNRGDQPIVFNTYQTYLKGMETFVIRDLDRSRREGWRFGAKVVRGAYMVSERKKAAERGVEAPIHETYEDTEASFHASLDAILAHTALENAPALSPGWIEGPGSTAGAEVMVATHNRGSIERTLEKMKEFGTERDHVNFGQLLGMADHVTFTLGGHGYKAYKYVPYGPIGEVMPYLIRRTLENSTLLGSAGVQEEKNMVTREVWRRLIPFR